MKIHIIGAGNLGISLAIGLSKFAKNTDITVTRRNAQLIKHLECHNIKVESDNTKDLILSDIIILAVKPHQVDEVFKEIIPHLSKQIIVSAVSGLTLEMMAQKSNNKCAAVRIMPNIAAQYGESATCIAFGKEHNEAGKIISELFNQVGTSTIIEEKLMDGATVLGACGTAFALRYIRAAMQAGIEIGFDSQTALSIASQTVKGAALMALVEKSHPEQLIDKVTTPQGITIVGLNEMEHEGFSSSLIKGIKTSYNKIKK